MNFDQFSFNAHIADAIRAVGYSHPTPIQKKAIPLILQGRDLLGLAQTGTGKTAAFVLPILEQLDKNPFRALRVLILEPTRELAEQIHQSIADLNGDRAARSATIYGGVSRNAQIRNAQRGIEIFVACPGRMLDLLDEGHIDVSSIETLVLDEADRLFDMGFLPDIRRILRYLPSQRQTLLFSATMPEDIRALAANILRDPAHVQVGAAAPVNTVSHALYPVSEMLKSQLLLSVLEQTPTGRVLVFTRTKRRACKLTALLAKKRYRVSALQGDMKQNHRQSAIDGFRSGKYDILVATDIAARGIDVSEISHVINYDMPDTADTYTHRIGRTGRACNTGEAFTFIAQADEPIVRQVEKILGSRIERRCLAGFAPEGKEAGILSGSGTLMDTSLQRRIHTRKFRLGVAGRKRRLRSLQ
ncbi:MAG TPA: DEAD/DEAH box helicase [Acidobacteriota bacterium]|nr:DEAD/DEAH box helicase [Acidobacteriota bacterium]